ncbi:thiol:disulfide interchange protein DsbG [Acidihalobacter ferrooxydans]|uniref:Thiol:disulfide interchange protein DsbG n=1 Tax=Acidihalobacter ferrooxydans TaxID=1765967 RepID=A0A1P8UI11_9GAMM|nr:thiol:disulfide interchange protein DsbG [Acidihalobacter ferrooxydans]APZ43459.1 thiol:disulfide interchange protein DsbG [Acidihalobacter ferrooxydans]
MKLNRTFRFCILAASLLISAPSFAAESTSSPPILAKLPGHPEVLSSEPVKGTNLTAWLLKAGSRMGVVYTGSNGQYLVAGGQILTESGPSNVAQALMTKYYQTHDFKPLVAALKKAAVIHQGSAGPLIYAFWDPNCIFCHKLWDEIQPAIKAGKIQVDWVPVGVIKKSSPAKAAAILAAASPIKAMQLDENKFIVRTEEGGIKPMKNVPAKYHQQVVANTALFQNYGMEGTPSIVYQAGNGQWHVFPGLVSVDELLKAAH